MDLNAWVDVNFAKLMYILKWSLWPNFVIFFFHFDISQHQDPTFIQYKISAKYTKPFWRNGLKYQGRHKFFRVDVNFQTVLVKVGRKTLRN